jgi:hypothetical protein
MDEQIYYQRQLQEEEEWGEIAIVVMCIYFNALLRAAAAAVAGS